MILCVTYAVTLFVTYYVIQFVTLVIVRHIVYNHLTMGAAPDNLDKSFAAYWHQQYMDI